MTTYQGVASGGVPGIEGLSSTGTLPIRGLATGVSAGVYGQTLSSAVPGVLGSNYASSGGYGVYGMCSTNTGVFGDGFYGVWAQGSGHGVGITAIVSGAQTGSRAGEFYGDVYVGGSITKFGGGFLIDHPLDPANRTLAHSFVESPERKNLYDGVAVADSAGNAEVTLPGYFEVLNDEFRYQLTALGLPAPDLHIAAEVQRGAFRIAGANPGQRICWQVSGVRKDAWALANSFVIDAEKPDDEKGSYHHPEVFGESSDKSRFAVLRKTAGISLTPQMISAPTP